MQQAHGEPLLDIWVIYSMLALHAFIAGFAIGLARHMAILFTLTLTIGMHKWLVAFALAIKLSKVPFKKAVLLYTCFALATPLGVALGTYLGVDVLHSQQWLAILLSMTAGTFIYLGSIHYYLTNKQALQYAPWRHISMFASGLLLMLFFVWGMGR